MCGCIYEKASATKQTTSPYVLPDPRIRTYARTIYIKENFKQQKTVSRRARKTINKNVQQPQNVIF